ncbi:dephospho-CoA kinase [Gluconacetobacter diazotrophicus PA1 5]|uniref:Dephospho-CoA kinase n=2 Tax=Gluconacetobacter diazotrophicus TaxID=33996 RepID=A9HRH0_GLUDA|nr:dephospho-CoA kinase [Gluconacetobacter diazotrophicus]ACI53111.1 dephospho-CoA kinase [Gluconacetobacter diazotrophicus PA1 5]MBB2155952.1 dephospho-CoA kinase [Gluconacetobacter diazotrophicus]TWB05613.1 dephospho-CoA kinase [Gluconacetobacter diazotrophicus]CAP56908.1 putative dephospho-CoA kinase [Gluconacetobacter diazotrophicus PA1 5]
MRVLGLTGGIGMGKSTVARMLRSAGFPIFDADAAVHALQAPGGRALPAIARLVPGSVHDGVLDRAVLRRAAIANPAILKGLERILHPMVRQDRDRFLARARRAGHSWAVLDVPLLFETGGERACDRVVVVSAPPDVQKHRVARRRGMAPDQVAAVIARQMPDREKRRRADDVIQTGLSRADTIRRVRRLVARLRATAGRKGGGA